MITKWISLAPALAALLLTSSCGVELVGGEGHGDVETVVTDDPEPSQPNPSRSPDSGPRLNRIPQLSQLPAGALLADLAVSLVTEGGGTLPLTEGSARVELSLSGADSMAVGYVTVPAGVYPRVRLTFTSVEAEIEGGIALPTPARVRVDLSGGPLQVESSVQVRVRKDGLVRLIVDLNSAEWLNALDPVSLLVPATAFSGAISVEAVEED